ncbi:hypothetical protein P4482_05710 [Neobacillus thermocopriae]|nr:hypothetical protein [Neobacillus thermocopriae]MED3713712.1 hypothetical protein [Neobacillus thermocopriae]
MSEKEKNDIDKEEEKQILLDYLRMQNEALKRIYKRVLEKEENQ